MPDEIYHIKKNMIAITKTLIALILGMTIVSCNQVSNSQTTENTTAKVTEVTATGSANNYTFAVTVSSPDTGCDRYADWWEVVTPEGELIYRRVLLQIPNGKAHSIYRWDGAYKYLGSPQVTAPHDSSGWQFI